MMICRICNSNMFFLQNYQDCVIGHSVLKNIPFHLNKCPVDLYICPDCNHIQMENSIDEGYYQHYISLEENEQKYYGNKSNMNAERINKLQNLNMGNSLLDIGCGKGDILKIAENFFSKVIGVEPSKLDSEIAKRRGLKVINQYFNNNFKTNETFDAFISTMVFEHLESPVEVLKKAYEVLSDSGVGLINIPNGQMIMKKGLYHQIISEHINYFSPYSIMRLAQQAGFYVVEIEEDNNLLEINAYLQKASPYIEINKKKQQHKKKLQQFLRNCDFVLAWGGGNKAEAYSSLLSDGIITKIVDSDENKWGKYISGLNIPIEPLQKHIIDQSDAIIIMASTYNIEIINKLRDEYNYIGKIIYFDNIKNEICMVGEKNHENIPVY